MSKLVPTDLVKRTLLGGWPSDVPSADNPFVTEGDCSYVRFDKITIRSRQPHPGVQVVYSFCGRDVFIQAAEQYEPGMELHLCGLDAKVAVILSD